MEDVNIYKNARATAGLTQERWAELLAIADDGVVDETERPDFEEIVQELMELFSAAMSVKFSGGESTGINRDK